jgi:hypothetical protein
MKTIAMRHTSGAIAGGLESGYRFLALLILCSSLLMGCNVSSKEWVNQMVHELETAHRKAVDSGTGNNEKNSIYNQIVQKYFPVGMPKEEAFKRVMDLKEEGFKVTESRHEGSRVWPDGDFEPWKSASIRRNMQNGLPVGTSRITFVKRYREAWWAIFETHVGISLSFSDSEAGIENTSIDLALMGL